MKDSRQSGNCHMTLTSSSLSIDYVNYVNSVYLVLSHAGNIIVDIGCSSAINDSVCKNYVTFILLDDNIMLFLCCLLINLSLIT